MILIPTGSKDQKNSLLCLLSSSVNGPLTLYQWIDAGIGAMHKHCINVYVTMSTMFTNLTLGRA